MSEQSTLPTVIDNEETAPASPANGEGVSVIQSPAAIGVDLSTPAKLQAAIQQAQNAMAFVEQVVELAVKTSRPGAILSQDGKPYWTEAECERLLSLMGGGRIVITQPPMRLDERGGHFEYTAMVEVTHRVLGVFSGFGSASSRDKFLGTNDDAWKKRDDGKGRKLEQVSRHNIAQHALTRAKGSAIRRMLGLNNRTWEELNAWGLKEEDCAAHVEYKNNKSSGSRSSGKGKALTPKGKRLFAIWKADGKKHGGDIKQERLLSYLEENHGFTGKDPFRAPDKAMHDLANAIEEGLFGSE